MSLNLIVYLNKLTRMTKIHKCKKNRLNHRDFNHYLANFLYDMYRFNKHLHREYTKL